MNKRKRLNVQIILVGRQAIIWARFISRFLTLSHSANVIFIYVPAQRLCKWCCNPIKLIHKYCYCENRHYSKCFVGYISSANCKTAILYDLDEVLFRILDNMIILIYSTKRNLKELFSAGIVTADHVKKSSFLDF